MRDTFYSCSIPLKTALLSDLHDRPFESIILSLKKNRPDIICFTGDLIHRIYPGENELTVRLAKNALPFLKACAGSAPTFVSLGNHDWNLREKDIAAMKETGVTVLDNEWVRACGIIIGGLSSSGFTAYKEFCRGRSEAYPRWTHADRPQMTEPELAWLNDMCAQEGYKLLLCHHPEYRDRFLGDLPVDLILCGHAHGGQIRLFGKGLFAPGQGIFPKYTAGIHGNMIISTGLANTGAFIPRLFNPREIVYIQPLR